MDVDKGLMDTLKYIIDKYNIDLKKPSPFEINCDRLVDLPILFKELGFEVGAEIGVARGNYSEILARTGFKLYSIDPYKQLGKGDFRKQKHYNGFYEEAKQKLEPYDCTIIKKSSMEAIKEFKDNSLDFVFIDANHRFEYVTEDIAGWSKKVRKGGIVSGHDVGGKHPITDTVHVKVVIEGWTRCYRIHPWFILLGQSWKETSWFWVKR